MGVHIALESHNCAATYGQSPITTNICYVSKNTPANTTTALNCTVASVPAREYVFVLTDANARTGKRGEGGGEADSKVLGAYSREKLNENGKLLLGFAEDNKLTLLNTFFCTPKSGVS